MPMLGLDVPRKVLDELFDSWDPDGSGSLSPEELEPGAPRPPRDLAPVPAALASAPAALASKPAALASAPAALASALIFITGIIATNHIQYHTLWTGKLLNRRSRSIMKEFIRC